MLALWVESDRSIVVLIGAVVVALLEVGVSTTYEQGAIVGIKADRLVEVLDRAIVFALSRQPCAALSIFSRKASPREQAGLDFTRPGGDHTIRFRRLTI